MRTLYHLWLSPFCRKVRITLIEKNLDFELKSENPSERRSEFLALNPACDIPVLSEDSGPTIANSSAICEYLEEIRPEPPLYPGGASERAEIRRLIGWFDIKFNIEVTENLVGEKLMKRLLRKGAPDSRAIRAGRENCHIHLDYIDWLIERRNWLGGDNYSMADIAAGSHLSCLDYIDDVPWADHQLAREWYARLKSRPSFRTILADHIPGEPPPKHYADLDF